MDPSSKGVDSSRVTFGLTSKAGLQVGLRGKKYGLVTPGASSSIFGAAALEQESTAEQVRRDALAKQSCVDVQRMHARALEADPTAFDYDGVYDAMQQRRADQSSVAKASDNKPRYIGAIIEAAKLRTVESDRAYERKLLKEREVDADLYEDKDKYITSAYRQKLAERAVHDAEQSRLAELEAREDVTKRRDLTDFHRNLLFGNLASRSAPAQSTGEPPSQPHAEPHPKSRVADEPHSSAQPHPSALPTAARAAPEPIELAQGGPSPTLLPESHRIADGHHAEPHPSPRVADEALRNAGLAAAHGPGPRPAAPEPPSGVKFARRNDDETVMSARERYLQRKAKQ